MGYLLAGITFVVVVCGNSNEKRKKKTKKTKRNQRNYFFPKKVELTLYFCTAPLRPCPHVSVLVFFFSRFSLPPTRIREKRSRKTHLSKTLSSVEILEKAGLSFTCWRVKTEVFQYDDVIHHILLAWRMLRKGCYRLSFLLAFSCGWPKTIRIR